MSDLISREQALKDYQDKLCEGVSCVDCPFCIDRLYGGCKVEKYLINLPSAEKTGKWTEVQRLYPAEHQALCECSVCGNTVWVYVGARRWHYCPNCGARMVEQ